jgi:hypothetical protein
MQLLGDVQLMRQPTLHLRLRLRLMLKETKPKARRQTRRRLRAGFLDGFQERKLILWMQVAMEQRKGRKKQ